MKRISLLFYYITKYYFILFYCCHISLSVFGFSLGWNLFVGEWKDVIINNILYFIWLRLVVLGFVCIYTIYFRLRSSGLRYIKHNNMKMHEFFLDYIQLIEFYLLSIKRVCVWEYYVCGVCLNHKFILCSVTDSSISYFRW